MAGCCRYGISEGIPSVLVVGRFTPPTAHFQSEYAGFYFDVSSGDGESTALLKAELDWMGCRAPVSRSRTCVDEEENGREGATAPATAAVNCSPGGADHPSLDSVQEIIAEEVTKIAAQGTEAFSMEAGETDHIDYVVFCSTISGRTPN